MSPTIAFVAHSAETDGLAREMAPAGFDLRIVKAGSADYGRALGEAEYLVGYADALVAEPLYRAGPRLRLIQLLSAGYDRADIAAARKARVPVANNGGANSVAVSEHAVMLMLAVSRRLIWQHGNVSSGRWRGNEARSIHELRGRTLGIVGFSTDPDARGEETELPKVEKSAPLTLLGVHSEGKETQPPGRYSEAGLVKELESRGIGRPSTYARIIRTLETRGYVDKQWK